MHLKNMALLKIAEPGDSQFRSVRMAPLYDAVTTRVFPNLKHDRMTLKRNGVRQPASASGGRFRLRAPAPVPCEAHVKVQAYDYSRLLCERALRTLMLLVARGMLTP